MTILIRFTLAVQAINALAHLQFQDIFTQGNLVNYIPALDIENLINIEVQTFSNFVLSKSSGEATRILGR